MHLRDLRQGGIAMRHLAADTGLSPATLRAIAGTMKTAPRLTIRQSTADAILAVDAMVCDARRLAAASADEVGATGRVANLAAAHLRARPGLEPLDDVMLWRVRTGVPVRGKDLPFHQQMELVDHLTQQGCSLRNIAHLLTMSIRTVSRRRANALGRNPGHRLQS